MDARPEPPEAAGEAETLLGYIAFLRATLSAKCEGLTNEQLRTTLPPSTMTLGGMLAHLAYVEDFWCTRVLGGRPMPEPWASVDWRADPDWDWHVADERAGDEVRALWRGRVAASDEVIATLIAGDAAALSSTHSITEDREVSLRWVLTHLIEEYSRHCGHADLIRESIDGQTGE